MIVLAAAWRYIFGHPHSDPDFFLRPFYDATTFSWKALFACTSVAVLTYIGFDGISTLSEEVENPRRNILLATVYTCLAIGILSAIEVYVAQLIWPATEPFPNVDQAYVYVTARTWAPLFAIVGGRCSSRISVRAWARNSARRDCCMEWDAATRCQSHFSERSMPKHHVPRNNVLFVGVDRARGRVFPELTISGAEMLNFGALIAFMGVNLAAFLRYFVRATRRNRPHFVPPLLGFFICLGLWLNLSWSAKNSGAIWMLAGIIFGAIKTKGFRGELVNFDIPAEE